MDVTQTSTAPAPSNLSPTVLRSDILEPGDVLLTHGGGWESKTIAVLSGGEFSHAALVVNHLTLLESDGGVIGYRAIQWLGRGLIAGKPATLARLLADLKRLAVYRHPDLRNLPRGTFDAALRAELDYSYGRDYSEMYRLVLLANLSYYLKWLVAVTFKLFEHKTLEQIPGPFCSELVSRVYERIGLRLFQQNRPAAEISPNHLAKSKLVCVEGAVIPAGYVEHYEAIEPCTNIVEKLYPATGDPNAKLRHYGRVLEQVLNDVDEISRGEGENV
jgi:hypothetical protein